MKTKLTSGIFAVAALFAVSALQAQQPVTIALSTVGNPGNAVDPATGSHYGNVSYTFNIGTYDVTVSQYTAFLNAVAQTDPYSLYNTHMGTFSRVDPTISRSGSSGSYSYAVMGSSGDLPVTNVSWFDAARFCNWMQNGEPQTHVEDETTTETGAYTLNGDTTSGFETKNAMAAWWVPSESEWYKAAYYDSSLNSGLGGYWTYATRSNLVPGNSWALRTSANEANYLNGSDNYTVGGQPYLTPVGSFTNSASAYGTYDQAGDVFNWTDTVNSSSYLDMRGGCWSAFSDALASSASSTYGVPSTEENFLGFRVANVPEPGCGMLIGLGGILLAARRRKPFAV